MRKLILAGAVASMLAAAPSASATIVVNQSIAGVSLGMTQAQVVATLGPPKATTTSTDKATGQPVVSLTYNSAGVDLIGDKAVAIGSSSRSEKTANGAGVGTKEKTLRKKVKGLRCSGKKFRQCVKGSGRPGTPLTSFIINSKTKKVRGVLVGIVID